jgi:hypothetical protein
VKLGTLARQFASGLPSSIPPSSRPPSSGQPASLHPAHAGLVPHKQAPVAEQAFAVPAAQGAQPPPFAPHSAADGTVQVLFTQQPPGHDIPSQMQAWPEHR